MTKGKPKRKIKDSVFTDLFRDRRYLLQLYKALHPEDGDATEDAISDITLQSVLVDAEYNDLGFLFGDRLIVLVESQSTWSVNIVVRALLYLAQTYHDYLKRTGQYLYGSGKVDMPRPELYVIYTGDKEDIPDRISLRMEFFAGEEAAVDAEIRVLRQPEEDNIIGQYIIFCKVYNEQMRKHGRTRKAVTETLRICRDRNVLKDYLESRKQEVEDIMMTLFDEDYIFESYVKDVERRTEEKAIKETTEKTAREVAIRMLRNGEPPEKIAQYVPELSAEDIRCLAAELMQPV